MDIIKRLTTKTQTIPENAFREVYEQYVTEASFLWVLRSIGVRQPHYDLDDIADLEKRIEANLDGLMTSLDLAWELCLEALSIGQPGEIFTVAVVAFRSRDVEKIKTVVLEALQEEENTKALVSAIAWLPEKLVRDWITKFLSSKNLEHKFLAIAACSARGEAPGEILGSLLKREDCLNHKKLRARALRLIGELKLQDYRWAIDDAYSDEDPEVKFWVNWSTIMLGDPTAVRQLETYVQEPGDLQRKAVDVAFRVLPIDQARAWISKLSSQPENVRIVIEAVGILGDPHAVPWLIEKMRHMETAKLAGQSFTLITGIDLEKYELNIEAPEEITAIPNDDPQDTDVSLDEDENLPFPDVDKVASTWQKHGHKYLPGRRYFMGAEISEATLQDKLLNGLQRQRSAAAIELAIKSPQSPLINVAARSFT
ncbi:TIGR02270 family protein [Aliikangiella marina]|uniref:TIGR02270 family protein n=1 Tax=Aliikangiella marina TaxID=1712262 RepID=A0A545TGS5_9GAMM|nr:TIGR02270 family protein [Aliikangiella marina]TQV76396.1 TIGR02270 family protein [Aliikangiella marina]